ncbi:MAG: hypothetical protein F6J87_13470 [Spirulina sp. SIO3F2]|nr:hypothetical protein [Spirulina sp. SIO3F2]
MSRIIERLKAGLNRLSPDFIITEFILILCCLLFLWLTNSKFQEGQSIAQEVKLINNASVVSISEVLEHPEQYLVVAFSGIARSNYVPSARLSKKPCLYCKVDVTEKWRTGWPYGDRSYHYGEDLVETDIDQVPFTVENEDGSILVSPQADHFLFLLPQEGFYENRFGIPDEINKLTSFHQAVPTEFSTQFNFRRNFNQNLLEKFSQKVLDLASGRVTLGYSYAEEILPPDSTVFVVGYLDHSTSKPQLSASQNHPVLVSTHDCEETLYRRRIESATPINIALLTGGMSFAVLLTALYFWYDELTRSPREKKEEQDVGWELPTNKNVGELDEFKTNDDDPS